MRFACIFYAAIALFGCIYCSIACTESDIGFFFNDDGQYKNSVVVEVLSTDTIVLQKEDGEKNETITLIGLRAPEAPKKQRDIIARDKYGFVNKKPADPFDSIDEKAFSFAKDLLLGQKVRLEFDALKASERHTTLAYVFLLKDNMFVNAEILRHGFAHLHLQPPNTKYSAELRAAYRESRSEKRGLQGQ